MPNYCDNKIGFICLSNDSFDESFIKIYEYAEE